MFYQLPAFVELTLQKTSSQMILFYRDLHKASLQITWGSRKEIKPGVSQGLPIHKLFDSLIKAGWRMGTASPRSQLNRTALHRPQWVSKGRGEDGRIDG